MKKRKTYEVSVINKTYSKTYSNETKFYTSDTALELNFQLKEVEYDFDSAEIILLNIDDRSLVTRPVSKSAEGFTYELEDDIVEHYGEWKGQLKFNEGGEIYVSSPVGFRIENDLTNDRPPQLTEVNTWKNLRAIADGLISDIRSELELFEEKKLEIETAESERQSAENERQSAELLRIENENKRKIEIENIVKNGNFNDGLTNWVSDFSNSTVLNNTLINTGNGTGTQAFITQYLYGLTSGDVHYIYANVRVTNDLSTLLYLGVSAIPNVSQVSNPIKDTWYNMSGIYTYSKGIDTLRVRHYYSSETVQNGKSLEVKQVININLTKLFGKGNEPTKEEMDELIKVTGYIDGKYTLNNKEMLGYLMKGIREKANKKQEDWITPTLLNGATGNVQFRKDQFGRVEFRGKITASEGKSIFSLPIGYRPLYAFRTLANLTNSSNQARTVQIQTAGLVYVEQPYGTHEVHFDTISFNAE